MILLALLLAPVAPASDAELGMASGVVQVSSSFEAGRRELGTGVVVRVPAAKVGEPDHTFLLTCAHLSAGQSPEIAGQPLAGVSLGRRTDNFRDVDLIELDPAALKARPFATYRPNPDNLEAGDSRLEAYAESYGTSVSKAQARLSGGYFEVDADSLSAWTSHAKHPALRVTADEENPPFVLDPDWANGDQEGSWPGRDKVLGRNFNPEAPDPGSSLVFDPTTRTFTAPGRLAPGMSCAPLVRTAELLNGKKPLELRGLGTEFRAGMTGSTFTSPFIWEDEIRAYLSGDTKEDVPAQWETIHGLQYLKIGENSAEIVPVEHKAGNGVFVSPGNGVTVPPGNGVTVPPGNGVTVPPGNGVTVPPGNGVTVPPGNGVTVPPGNGTTVPPGNGVTVPPGNGVTVPPGNGVTVPPGKKDHKKTSSACDPQQLDAEDPWDQYGIKPGILWHGKEILGFSVDFDARNPLMGKKHARQGPVLIYPDRAGIEFYLGNEHLAKEAKPVPAGTPALDWLDQRYQMSKPAYQMISVDKSGLKASTIRRTAHGLTLITYGPPPQDERLEIRLNNYGALEDLPSPQNKELKTMVEVKGDKGNVYRIDLTDLLFQQAALVDPVDMGPYLANEITLREHAEIYSPHSVFSDRSRLKKLQDTFGPDHGQIERHVGVSVRRKCSNDELRVNFPEPGDDLPAVNPPCTASVPTFVHGLENVRELQYRINEKLNEYDVGMGRFVPSSH